MPNCFHFFSDRAIKEECSELEKMTIFKYFWSLRSVSPRFWSGQAATYTKFARKYVIACPVIFLYLFGEIRQRNSLLKLPFKYKR